MNLALVYDTETTGLPLFNQPSEHPDQPHMVQLGACLVDLDTRKIYSSIDVITRPDGWTIPDEVAAIHGITTEMAMDVGIPESIAVDMLLDMAERAPIRIGHNESFDARIIRIALKRLRDPFDPELDVPWSDQWKARPAECTAVLSTPICKLPPTARMRAAGRHNFKTPKLTEAYRHFTGKDLDGAHNAMVDVLGCMEVYFAVKAGSTGFTGQRPGYVGDLTAEQIGA